MRTFYLGISKPHWLGEKSPLPANVPVCLSRVRVVDYKTLPVANRPYLYDSGGFSTLSKDREDSEPARWDITPHRYVKDVRRAHDEIGPMDAAAIMDLMCERFMVARTGLTVGEHSRRSVLSCLELMWLDDTLPWMPVLQGDATNGPDDHLRCIDMYEEAGIDLTKAPLVGVGSVCRLQATEQIVDLFAALDIAFAGTGVRLHGFGVKTLGLTAVAPGLHSADSQAWSRRGRESGPCRHGLNHLNEANCPDFALDWYAKVLTTAAGTTAQKWRQTVQAYAERDIQDALFTSIPLPAPNMPTFGQALARALRVFMPDNDDPEQTELANAIDAFRETAGSTDSLEVAA